MRYEVEVNGRLLTLAVERRKDDGRFVVRTGDRKWTVDVSRVNSHVLSLLIQRDGTAIESREVTVSPDAASGQLMVGIAGAPVAVAVNNGGRWRRGDEIGARGSGPQRIVAPMPGKVVRIAAPAGTAVVPRQPVIVIEAMKMENELRALRAGTVTEVLVREGQSVDAGTLLAVVSPAS